MADNSRNRAAGGSGLGLAIVKRVIELHNGSVEIDSAAEKGTKVTVILPAVSPRISIIRVVKRWTIPFNSFSLADPPLFPIRFMFCSY